MAFIGVVLSRHKFTPSCPVGQTKEQMENYKKKMRKDLTMRYELIRFLESLNILEERWHDGYVELGLTVNCDYTNYVKWLKEQEEKEREEQNE